jgi:cell wall-associated NlpC family hydrolase
MAETISLKDLAGQKGYTVSYNKNTNNVSIANPTSGKAISFKSGEGKEYGLSGLINGSNYVNDSDKLLSALGDASSNTSSSNSGQSNVNLSTSSNRSDYLNSLVSGINSNQNNYLNNLTSNDDLRTQRKTDLNSMYDNLKNSQLMSSMLGRQQQEQTLNQQKYDSNLNYENLLGQLQQEKDTATPQYQDMKEQQFLTTLQDMKKINENKANQGQYNGGSNAQVQSDQLTANQETMNKIVLQEQQLYDDINRRATEAFNTKQNEIKKIDENIQLMKDQGAAQDSAIVQALEAQKIQSNIDLENILTNREMQIAQLGQEYEQSKISNILNIVGQQEQMSQNQQANSYNMAELFGKYLTPEQLAEAGNDLPGYLQKNGIDTLAGQTAREDILTKQTQNKYLAQQLEANLEGAKLQNVGQSLANQIASINMEYLPQEKQMAINTAQIQLQNGQLQNAYQTIVNAGLPAKLTAELEGLYANTLQTSVETDLAINKATGSGATSIINYASKFLGTKYVLGGNSLTKGIDCSGLTQQAFKQYGVNLPRTTFEQVKQGKSVSKSNLQPGDLVFFNTTSEKNSHVGIYIGAGKFINAQSSKGVAIASLNDDYWSKRYSTARRVIK